MPSMLVAMVQGVVSSLPLNGAVALGLFAFAAIKTRTWALAFFMSGCYFAVALYVTLVRASAAPDHCQITARSA